MTLLNLRDAKRIWVGGIETTRFWLGPSIEWMKPVPGMMRVPHDVSSTSQHSGHSLTDTYLSVGTWPGVLRNMAVSVFGQAEWSPSYNEPDLLKSETIPGSPAHYRWNNADPYNYPAYDALMITEGGPVPRISSGDGLFSMQGTLDHLCRYAASQIELGRNTETILWSIWPKITLGQPPVGDDWGYWETRTFDQALDEYGEIFKYIADYVTWKMKGLYPALPENYRVWLFPGHLFMKHVYADVALGLVPGITSFDELFNDDIHPSVICSYGLSSFVFTLLYQMNLSVVRPSYVETGVSQAQADYFWNLSWAIARAYEPAGLGGTQGAAVMYDPLIETDPLPGWTLADPGTYDGNSDWVAPGEGGGDPDPGGDLPTWMLSWSPTDGYAGPTLSGPLPIADNVLDFQPGFDGVHAPLELGSDSYLVMAINLGPQPSSQDRRNLLMFTNGLNQRWSETGHVIVRSTWINALGVVTTRISPSANTESNPKLTGKLNQWFIFEAVMGAANSLAYIDGAVGDQGSDISPPLADTTHFAISSGVAGNDPIPVGHGFKINAIGIANGAVTEDQRIAARAWATSQIGLEVSQTVAEQVINTFDSLTGPWAYFLADDMRGGAAPWTWRRNPAAVAAGFAERTLTPTGTPVVNVDDSLAGGLTTVGSFATPAAGCWYGNAVGGFFPSTFAFSYWGLFTAGNARTDFYIGPLADADVSNRVRFENALSDIVVRTGNRGTVNLPRPSFTELSSIVISSPTLANADITIGINNIIGSITVGRARSHTNNGDYMVLGGANALLNTTTSPPNINNTLTPTAIWAISLGQVASVDDLAALEALRVSLLP